VPEKIQIRIFPDGTVKAETLGIKGQKCTDVIPLLESLLKAEALKAEYTREYYEVEEEVELQQQQNNILKS